MDSMIIDLNRPGALTHDSVRIFLASVEDRTDSQIRVTKAGIAFISITHVGAEAIDDLAFRLETFSSGSDHVGASAALDPEWVDRIYQVLRDNWPNPTSSYIDSF